MRLLLMFHVAFGMFFALFCVCALRGLGLYVLAWHKARLQVAVQPAMSPEHASVMLREVEL